VQNVNYCLEPCQGTRYVTFNLGETRFVKDKDGFYKFSATNIPAFHEEPRIPPEDELRSWLFLYFSDDTKMDTEKYWKEYGKRVFELTKDFMKVDGDVKGAATTIVGDANDPEDKLRRIYDFCRTKIKNTSDDASGLTDDDWKKFIDIKSQIYTMMR